MPYLEGKSKKGVSPPRIYILWELPSAHLFLSLICISCIKFTSQLLQKFRDFVTVENVRVLFISPRILCSRNIGASAKLESKALGLGTREEQFVKQGNDENLEALRPSTHSGTKHYSFRHIPPYYFLKIVCG